MACDRLGFLGMAFTNGYARFPLSLLLVCPRAVLTLYFACLLADICSTATSTKVLHTRRSWSNCKLHYSIRRLTAGTSSPRAKKKLPQLTRMKNGHRNSTRISHGAGIAPSNVDIHTHLGHGPTASNAKCLSAPRRYAPAFAIGTTPRSRQQTAAQPSRCRSQGASGKNKSAPTGGPRRRRTGLSGTVICTEDYAIFATSVLFIIAYVPLVDSLGQETIMRHIRVSR